MSRDPLADDDPWPKIGVRGTSTGVGGPDRSAKGSSSSRNDGGGDVRSRRGTAGSVSTTSARMAGGAGPVGPALVGNTLKFCCWSASWCEMRGGGNKNEGDVGEVGVDVVCALTRCFSFAELARRNRVVVVGLDGVEKDEKDGFGEWPLESVPPVDVGTVGETGDEGLDESIALFNDCNSDGTIPLNERLFGIALAESTQATWQLRPLS